ncbi:MAG: transposase [Pseudonocardiales bacterium]|nr:transposase [Pseudonocardiales bacterium]
MLADLACAIADGSEVISDFRVLADQKELFGLVASVSTTWRTLSDIATGGPETLGRITVAVAEARCRAWAAAGARHGGLPGVRIADKVLEGVTCIRLDATVTAAHSEKELAEPNFKGFGHHPLLSYYDNTGEPLAGMMRRGGAGSNTVADHLTVPENSIAALLPEHRRQLMVSCDGAGASHGLIARLDALAARPGYQLTYSVGWDLGARERTAISRVPEGAWQVAIDHRGAVRERRAEDACQDFRCAHERCWHEQAHVTELTGLLREDPAGNQLAGWPPSMRVFARRERPHPGAQLSLFAINSAWLAAALIAATLLALLRLLALEGELARAEPKTLRYKILHAAARLTHSGRRRRLKISRTWSWATAITTAWTRLNALPQAP